MRRLKKIKVPRMIKKPFTQAEMEHLRCNAECQRDIAIMAFLYSTAARIGEVVRLNRKDIDWGNKEVIIYGEKGKKERRVYLTDDCAYHLHKYLLSRDDTNPALFVSNKRPHTRLGKQAIQLCGICFTTRVMLYNATPIAVQFRKPFRIYIRI